MPGKPDASRAHVCAPCMPLSLQLAGGGRPAVAALARVPFPLPSDGLPKSCHECRLVDYNAALATICFMLFLGFADDVLDIPWR